MAVEGPAGSQVIVRVDFFGSIRVRAPGSRQLEIRSRRALAILAYLLLGVEEVVPRVRLQRMFWGQRYSEQAQASLRRELYILRRLFAFIDEPVLNISRSTVGLDRSLFWLDGFSNPIEGGSVSPSVVYTLLEALEGLSSDFDCWISDLRERLCSASGGEGAIDDDDARALFERRDTDVSVGIIAPIGDNKALQVFAWAIQQELANQLSRMRWLRVRVENKSTGGQSSYLLCGSIFQYTDRYTLSLRLVDSSASQVIAWSKRFDFETDGGFELILVTASEIAGYIDPEITRIETLKANRQGCNTGSRRGALLLAMPMLYSFDKENWIESGKLIDRAIDPAFPDARALAYKSLHILTGSAQGWEGDTRSSLELARCFSRQATAVDPCNSIALAVDAHVSSFGEKGFRVALSNFERAESFNPACGITQAYKSLTLSYLQRCDEARSAINRARETLIYDPYWSFIDACEVVYRFFSEDYEGAIRTADNVLLSRKTFTNIVKIKTLSLFAVGDFNNAMSAHGDLLDLDDRFRWRDFFQSYPFGDKKFADSVSSFVPRELLLE